MCTLKNTKNILVLLLLSLVTSTSFAMEQAGANSKKELNTDCEQDVICKIGPFQDEIRCMTTQKISSELAEKLANLCPGNKIDFLSDEIDILIVYDQKTISILDIEQQEKIYEVDINILKEKLKAKNITFFGYTPDGPGDGPGFCIAYSKTPGKGFNIISFSIIEKNKMPFLKLYMANIPRISKITYYLCEYDIINSTVNILASSDNLHIF